MWVESLMYIVFIKLRYTVLYLTCLRLLSRRDSGYRKHPLHLLRGVDGFYSLFYCCDVSELLICISGILLASLWMIFLMCGWIWSDSMLWRISASTFISDIGLRRSLCEHVLYSFKDFLGRGGDCSYLLSLFLKTMLLEAMFFKNNPNPMTWL